MKALFLGMQIRQNLWASSGDGSRGQASFGPSAPFVSGRDPVEDDLDLHPLGEAQMARHGVEPKGAELQGQLLGVANEAVTGDADRRSLRGRLPGLTVPSHPTIISPSPMAEGTRLG